MMRSIVISGAAFFLLLLPDAVPCAAQRDLASS
jgi:hypothetical protein